MRTQAWRKNNGCCRTGNRHGNEIGQVEEFRDCGEFFTDSYKEDILKIYPQSSDSIKCIFPKGNIMDGTCLSKIVIFKFNPHIDSVLKGDFGVQLCHRVEDLIT